MTYIEARFGKAAENMTLDEIEAAIESMEDTFRACEEIGQGISSKETVSFNTLRKFRACKKLKLTEAEYDLAVRMFQPR